MAEQKLSLNDLQESFKEELANRVEGLTIDEVPLDERQKRQAVFTKTRQTVLIKFFACGMMPGLEKKERDEFKIDDAHAADAEKRGLDFNAYRVKGDSGFCLLQKEPLVSITGLSLQLQMLGLRYVGGHNQIGPKGPVTTLNFSTDGEAAPMPEIVKSALGDTYNHCTVWCNLRYNPDGKGQHRLDTITLAKRVKPLTTGVRKLHVEGNTYKLV